MTHSGENIIVDALADDEVLVAHEERNVVRLPDDVLLVPERERVVSIWESLSSTGKEARGVERMDLLAGDPHSLDDRGRECVETRHEGQKALNIDALVVQEIKGTAFQSLDVSTLDPSAFRVLAGSPAPVAIPLDFEPAQVPPVGRHRHVLHEINPRLDLSFGTLVGGPPRVADGIDGAAFLGQAEIGIVGAERDSVLGPGREHAVCAGQGGEESQ